jgi:hypothetical protein
MFFDDYQSHSDAKLRGSLLWEYDPEHFDWQAMRNVVVQRVVERGRREDFYAILNLFCAFRVQFFKKNHFLFRAIFLFFIFDPVSQKPIACSPAMGLRRRSYPFV